MKFLVTIVLALLVAYLSWPYYYVYRLDAALGDDNIIALAPLVDLEAVRDNNQRRIERTIDKVSGGKQEDDSLIGWLQSSIKDLTDTVVDQSLSLELVREGLRDLARAHSSKSPPYFISAIDYAFFESPTSFLIRLGDIDANPAYIRMSPEKGRWLITDIIP
jgi:hypothetical protein